MNIRSVTVLFFLNFFVLISFAQKEEMRGLWVATAKNIDYPVSKYSKPEAQQKEFIELLELCKNVGINAVFVQVRPAADAFYDSPYEPWSEWLTGKQGKTPEPYWDPMKFMIEECKKRDIEFHAWVNPFRAVANINTADIADNHITKRKPEWFFTYDINTYFDPGIPEVREYLLKILEDIVARYDVDGVHFDDYFYPYPVRDAANNIIPVPDETTFKKYGKSFSDVRDWRRDNLNRFIADANKRMKNINPTIKFGIGPSGVWRNKGNDPDGSDTRGLAHYDWLYADVVKWLKNDWIDYVAPQIYWHIGHPSADFATLVQWWDNHTYGKHLYIGQGIYMAAPDAAFSSWKSSKELPNQLRYLRKFKNVDGVIFYKASALKQNPLGYNDSLRTELFAEAAITPKMEWLPELVAIDIANIDEVTTVIVADLQAPPAPSSITSVKVGKFYMLTWKAPRVSGKDFDDPAVSYNIYRFEGLYVGKLTKKSLIKKTTDTHFFINRNRFTLFKKHYTFVITATDKAGNESIVSESHTIRLKKI